MQNLQISNCSKSKCKNADCNITANESALSYNTAVKVHSIKSKPQGSLTIVKL